MLLQVQRLERPQHAIFIHGIHLKRHATIVQPKFKCRSRRNAFTCASVNSSHRMTGISVILCGTNGTNNHGIYPGTITPPIATLVTTQTWDCLTGIQNVSTDLNNVITTKTLDDLGRATQVEVATGAARRQTNMEVAEPACSNSPCVVTSHTPVTLSTFRDRNTPGDKSVSEIHTLDQRGQIYLTQRNDIYVETLPRLAMPLPVGKSYEAVSNPFRTTADGWTRTTYDNMGRPIEIAHFDGSTRPYPWGTATTPVSSSTLAYNGINTTITDEALKVKIQKTDGLGRLTDVAEDPDGLNYTTIYTYDALNNLKSTTQGSQIRTFEYDSLSRLISATNPESGQVLYRYDASGNLIGKTDARGVVTTMTYDAMNRIKTKSYTGITPPTPAVEYCYDGVTTGTNCGGAPITGSNMKGRLTMVYSTASQTKYTDFTEFGEIKASQQVTGGITYAFPSYLYNKLSQVTSMTYPSGRVVRTEYDSAGRGVCVWGGTPATCPGATSSYASNVNYAAHGAIKDLTFGNNLVEATTFNGRLQPTAIKVPAAGTLLNLAYTYGTSAATNNGNVQTQIITAPGQPTLTQSYTYDGVNRLATFTETGGGANQYYCYDQFGNRYQPGFHLVCNPNTAVNWIPYSGQTPTSNLFPNNQWAAGSGVTYDLAGNQTGITSASRTFEYDAENRQEKAMVNSVATNYTYDGDGRRVIKKVGNTSTVFVYDAAGTLAAEYGGPTNPLTGTTYLTSDHLVW